MKTQLNLWLYEADAVAIRAAAATDGVPIGELVTRAVLNRDPAHPPTVEQRVQRLEGMLLMVLETMNPKHAAIVKRILADDGEGED